VCKSGYGARKGDRLELGRNRLRKSVYAVRLGHTGKVGKVGKKRNLVLMLHCVDG
jgi:hypothetical protein